MSVPPRSSGSGGALAAEGRRCHPQPSGCPLCGDAPALAAAAVEITLDGDQITRHCYGCGARVRHFDWHGPDGLPVRYVGHLELGGQFAGIFALYRTGAVKAVPAVAVNDATRVSWPETFAPQDLTRAVLAHLVGLDVAPHLAAIDEAGPICRVVPAVDGYCGHAEWSLSIDDINEWLEIHR